MPFILGPLCSGGMVVPPIILIFLFLPIADWEVDGRLMSYREMWLSGDAAALAACLILVAAGAWGLAARNRASRWSLVFAPVLPYVILALFRSVSLLPADPIPFDVVASAILTAIVVYSCLFHLRSVREYLDGADK
jgi:hypothetical protein